MAIIKQLKCKSCKKKFDWLKMTLVQKDDMLCPKCLQIMENCFPTGFLKKKKLTREDVDG
jgi:hypothetical protein